MEEADVYQEGGCAGLRTYLEREGRESEYNAVRAKLVHSGVRVGGPAVTQPERPWNDERNTRRLVLGPDKRYSPLVLGVLDLETFSLNADTGIIMCGCLLRIDAPEQEILTFRADDYSEWIEDGLNDCRLTADLLAAMESVDIVYAHNGVQYDVPWLRTRALRWGLPPVEPRKIIDPVLVARKNFRLHSNTLDNIARFIGASNEKNHVDLEYWMKAFANRDKQSMDYIVDHCQRDILVLAEVAREIRAYSKQIDQFGSFR